MCTVNESPLSNEGDTLRYGQRGQNFAVFESHQADFFNTHLMSRIIELRDNCCLSREEGLVVSRHCEISIGGSIFNVIDVKAYAIYIDEVMSTVGITVSIYRDDDRRRGAFLIVITSVLATLPILIATLFRRLFCLILFARGSNGKKHGNH